MTTLTLVTPFTDAFGVFRSTLELPDYLTYGTIRAARLQSKSGVDDPDYGYRMIALFAGLDFEKDLPKMDMRDIDAIDQHIAQVRIPKQKAGESTSTE